MSAAELWDTLSCSTAAIILSISHTVICTTFICTVVYVTYQFINKRKVEKSSQVSQKCGSIFIASIFICVSCSILVFGGKCYKISWEMYQLSLLIYYGMFGVQSFSLIVIFFDRIKRVFDKTPFQLSKCTKYSFQFILIGLPPYLFMILIGYSLCTQNCYIWVYLMTSSLLIYIILLILLVILFIYKLIQVYNNEHNNDVLIGAITKMTILASLSVIITFLDAISTILYFRLNDIYSEWTSIFISLIDLYTNFICIIFSYKIFKPFYHILCKCLDSKCRACWIKLITERNDVNIMIQIQSTRKNTDDLTITTMATTATETGDSYKSDVN